MSDPKPQPEADALERARDRLTDRVLAEALGQERAPDLSKKILQQAEEQKVEVASVGNRTLTRTGRRFVTGAIVAASLMVTVSVLLLPAVQTSREAARRNSERNALRELEISVAAPTGSPALDASDMRYQAPATIDEEIASRVESVADDTGPPAVGLRVLGVEREADAAESAAAQPASAPRDPQTQEFLRRMRASEEQRAAKDTSQLYTFSEIQPSTPAPARPQSSVRGVSSGRQPAFAQDRVAAGGSAASAAPAESGIAQMGRAKQLSRPGVAPGQVVAKESELGTRFSYFSEAEAAEEWSRQAKRRDRFKPVEALGDRYEPINENAFIKPLGEQALSTFGVDVDTASYTNVRQMLMSLRRLPPAAAVRVEEFVNYFDYDYEPPAAEAEEPFAASIEAFGCPWNEEHRLVRVGLKGREVEAEKRPLSNLVFLVDVSGSMNDPDKLPLVIEGLTALTDRLGENDRVAIVVYAGSEGVVLPSTSGDRKDEIRSALSRLQAGGSTAGGAGLRLACSIAEENKIPGGVNRVVLCTDGDFNVGLTGTDELTKLVESYARDSGVYMTVLGFGRGNLNDAMLESISGHGDGHYAYIDSAREARRVLSDDLSGTLVTIAKDVKLQVEFNPAKVGSYRLIGYENRVLAAQDFNDDRKDAGDIGAGHRVTALYEVVPAGVETPAPPVDGLKYQASAVGSARSAGGNEPEASAPGANQEPANDSNELLTLKIRYKQPEGGASKKLEFPLVDAGKSLDEASADSRWAAAAAQFAMLLRGSRYAGDSDYQAVLDLARPAIGDDPRGYRAEMLDLVRRAASLAGDRPTPRPAPYR